MLEFSPARRITGRVYLRCQSSNVSKWRFWFSNAVDSTFEAGQTAWCNRLGGAWRIHSARIGDGGPCFCGEVQTPPDVTGWTEVLFDGRIGREVAPGETFWSDEVSFSLPEGHFLVWEWEIEGEYIPCTMDSQAMTFVGGSADSLQWDLCCPMPDLFGAERKVKNRIAFWGDSITQGCATGTNMYASWVPKVAQRLGEEFSVWNLGLGYSRGSDAATCGAWMNKALQADTVGLVFGVNDLTSGAYRRGRPDNDEEILHSVTTLLEKLIAAKKRVILFTIPPFDYSESAYQNWKKVRRMYPELAEKYGVELFDFEAVLDPEAPYGNQYPYGAHPDGTGCSLAAEAFMARGFFEK